jgi:hypothetical protein
MQNTCQLGSPRRRMKLNKHGFQTNLQSKCLQINEGIMLIENMLFYYTFLEDGQVQGHIRR